MKLESVIQSPVDETVIVNSWNHEYVNLRIRNIAPWIREAEILKYWNREMSRIHELLESKSWIQ